MKGHWKTYFDYSAKVRIRGGRLNRISSRMWQYLSEPQLKLANIKEPKEMECSGYRWEKCGDSLVTLSTERERGFGLNS